MFKIIVHSSNGPMLLEGEAGLVQRKKKICEFMIQIIVQISKVPKPLVGEAGLAQRKKKHVSS